MRSRLLYLLVGAGIGAGSHYAYRQLHPELTLKKSSQELIDSYVSSHNLDRGYLISVLRSLGIMLKGFYHYGMINKLEGFNYIGTYLSKEEVQNDLLPITKLYCIFSPTAFICGHPEIQHGGATATILDQNMGELAILNSKEMVATADLFIKYKKPIKKDQYYVMESEVVKREGRRIWMVAKIKDVLTGDIMVETEALFMTVKWNNKMSNILSKFFQAINYKDYAEENKLPHLHLPHPTHHASTKKESSEVNENKEVKDAIEKLEKVVKEIDEGHEEHRIHIDRIIENVKVKKEKDSE